MLLFSVTIIKRIYQRNRLRKVSFTFFLMFYIVKMFFKSFEG